VLVGCGQGAASAESRQYTVWWC